MPENIRIEPATHAKLAAIARAQHSTLTETLSRAVEAYRREVFLEGLATDFAALHAKTEEWDEEKAERADWEQTNLDGLEGE